LAKLCPLPENVTPELELFQRLPALSRQKESHLWYDGQVVSLIAAGKIAPSEWIEALIHLEPADLDEEPFGPLVLVVRVPEDDDTGQFQKDLVASIMKETGVTPEQGRWPATAQFPTMRMSRRSMTEADQVELLSELSSAPHCLVPLRCKRPGGTGFLLGRSPSAEIRLSDPSVSAEHARFLLDDEGAKLVDVGSKNGTSLNGRRLEVDEIPWLQPMDRLTFGRVQAFACDPRVLRGVLRHDLKTLI
jgi:hypothetical protein